MVVADSEKSWCMFFLPQSVCLMLFKNYLQELHFWCFCRFSLFVLCSLFEGTWTKNRFNVQIFCLWHMPICSYAYVASLACIFFIHWSRGDLNSSLPQTWWVFLVFDVCQHFPHQTPTSQLREGTVKCPDYTTPLWFGQVGTIGRGWGPSSNANSIDCVIDLLGAVSGLRPCACVLVFKQRY